MEKLLDYTLGEASTERAGTCKWCFGTKNGKEYFIKEFLSPKYPYQDPVLTPEQIRDRVRKCNAFAARKLKIYDVVNRYSDGNDVRIYEYFRLKQKFFLSMEKIDDLHWTIQTVYSLPETHKRFLCAVICHAVAALHRGRLVHSDLKHENILYTRTRTGSITAKIIDFDSAFLETDVPGKDEISGDQVYFSPEAWTVIGGGSAPLTTKADIFALGVLFYRYFTGDLPAFYKNDAANYVGQAVLQGQRLGFSGALPPDLLDLLSRMLSRDPNRRPTAEEVYHVLLPETIKKTLQNLPAPDRPKYCTNCGLPFYGEGATCRYCGPIAGREKVVGRSVTVSEESGGSGAFRSDEPAQTGGSYFHVPTGF